MRILSLCTLFLAFCLVGCDSAGIDPAPLGADSVSADAVMDPYDITGSNAYYNVSGRYGCVAAYHFDGNGVNATSWSVSGSAVLNGVTGNTAIIETTSTGYFQVTAYFPGGSLTETFSSLWTKDPCLTP